MPEPGQIVINTGPLIALVAALGDLKVLESLYRQVLVPYEVCQEILAGGRTGFAVPQFEKAFWLKKYSSPIQITPFLVNSVGVGEAGVIQLAMNENIKTVCIDEMVGRRLARLNGLSVTGSIGILLRAQEKGQPISIRNAIQRMRDNGIWLSEKVIEFALKKAKA